MGRSNIQDFKGKLGNLAIKMPEQKPEYFSYQLHLSVIFKKQGSSKHYLLSAWSEQQNSKGRPRIIIDEIFRLRGLLSLLIL